MQTQLTITGILLILVSLVHLIFPRYFNWKEELRPLSLVNRQMMQVHTFFIGLVVFLMGLLCLVSAHELLHSPLGKKIAAGMGIFWLARLFIQFFGYSSSLWKGKTFETVVHIFFTLLWVYFSFVFLLTSFG